MAAPAAAPRRGGNTNAGLPGLGFLTLSELPEPPRSGHFTVDDDETVRVEAAEEDAKRQLLPLLRQSFQDHDNDSIPLSFSIPGELPVFEECLQECIDHGDDPGMWLLKTDKHMGAAASLALLPAAQALEAARKPRAEPLRPFVCAQQYIDDPLLINKRKFDVRVWVLVAGHEPFRVYLHKHGLALFNAQEYDPNAMLQADGTAAPGHVTDYSDKVEGSVWSLEKLKQHIGHEAYAELWRDIEDSVAFTFCRAISHWKAAKTVRANPFELVGVDFMVDSDMKPWLLEFHGNPYLAPHHANREDEATIQGEKASMIRDMVAVMGSRSIRAMDGGPRYDKIRNALAGAVKPQLASALGSSMLAAFTPMDHGVKAVKMPAGAPSGAPLLRKMSSGLRRMNSSRRRNSKISKIDMENRGGFLHILSAFAG